jgi:hypothetical protein
MMTSTAATRKKTSSTSRLLPPSLVLAATVFLVIAAVAGLLTLALSAVATAYTDPDQRSYATQINAALPTLIRLS